MELRPRPEPEPKLNIPGGEPVELGEMGNAEALTLGPQPPRDGARPQRLVRLGCNGARGPAEDEELVVPPRPRCAAQIAHPAQPTIFTLHQVLRDRVVLR